MVTFFSLDSAFSSGTSEDLVWGLWSRADSCPARLGERGRTRIIPFRVDANDGGDCLHKSRGALLTAVTVAIAAGFLLAPMPTARAQSCADCGGGGGGGGSPPPPSSCPFRTDVGWYGGWKVWNKDANQDCKIDSVVLEYSQATLWFPIADPLSPTPAVAFTDQYTNVYQVELTRFQTDGTQVVTGLTPYYALKLQEATGSIYGTKQIAISIKLARPDNSIVYDPIDGLPHTVVQYYFNDVGYNDIWTSDPYSASRSNELWYDLQLGSRNSAYGDTWTSGAPTLWYITSLDVHAGSGVAFHGQFGFSLSYHFWYITNDNNWMRCTSDTWAVAVP